MSLNPLTLVDKALEAAVELRLKSVVGNVLVIAVYFVLLGLTQLLPDEYQVRSIVTVALLVAFVGHVTVMLAGALLASDTEPQKERRSVSKRSTRTDKTRVEKAARG